MSLSSCKKGGVTDCINTTGRITNENRNVETFNSIILRDNVNLILTKSDSNSIIVEAGANIIGNISTKVSSDGVLELRNDNSCNWIRSFDVPVNVYLNYTDIDSIEYHSIGNITCTNTVLTDTLWISAYEGAGLIDLELDVKTLYCSLHYGTLDIVLRGKSGLSYVYSASFGLINMLDIESNFLYINNKSSNDVYVRVATYLGATIENIGDIYYAGNPETVTLEQIGSGVLRHYE